MNLRICSVNWFNYETILDNGHSVNVRTLSKQFEDMGITMPTLYGMKDNQIKVAKDNVSRTMATKAFEVYMEENNAITTKIVER